MSFQTFKSFLKLEQCPNPSHQNLTPNEKKQNSELSPLHDHMLKNANQSQSQSNPLKVSKRSKKLGSICNFILKVYSMLEEQQISHIVAWTQKGNSLSQKNTGSDDKNQLRPQTHLNSFQILDLQKFEQIVLPKYFKHSNMSSFVRQLNMYGFHKLRGDRGNYEFMHEKFNKNNKELLCEIRRKAPEFGVMSSSHLEENPHMSLQNLNTFDDKLYFLPQHRPATQQSLISFGDEFAGNNIFPLDSFISIKKISLDAREQNESSDSIEKAKVRKMEFIEQENNRLKKIKNNKLQKIKDLSSFNKSQIELKFSKVILSFLGIQLRQQLKKMSKQKFEHCEIIQKKEELNISLSNLANHILSNDEAKSFQSYTNQIQKLFNEQNSQVKR